MIFFHSENEVMMYNLTCTLINKLQEVIDQCKWSLGCPERYWSATWLRLFKEGDGSHFDFVV